MKSAAEWTADVIILVLTTLHACYVSCHIAAMWRMRKEFRIALRSPLLACICAACRIGRACVTVCFIVFAGLETTSAFNAQTLITAPALWVGNGALIAWVIRLLVLYDPSKRKRWGRYVNEKGIARALCWTYGGMEAVFWAAVAVHGMARTAVVARMMAILGTLLVVVASIGLAGPMMKVQDVEGLSRDARHLGAYVIAMFLGGGLVGGVPGMPAIVVKYWVIFLIASDAGLVTWTINVKPVRGFLKQHNISWWKFLARTGLKANTSRVACASQGHLGSTAMSHNSPRSGATSMAESPLATIMGLLPLKQAFGEFCQRALCSESFQFLIDASEFQSSVHAAQRGHEDESCFEEFLAIVNEYIKDNSNSEINIDGRTKKEILRFQERSSYDSLDVEGRSGVFLQGQKEIAKMLAENLLSKFKATAEYKEVAVEFLFEAT